MGNNLFIEDILENNVMYNDNDIKISSYVSELYQEIEDNNMKNFIQITHEKIMNLLEHLEKCNNPNKYFHAGESRNLIKIKKIVENFEENQDKFYVESEVKDLLKRIDFLEESCGTTIPADFTFKLPNKYKKIFIGKSDQTEIIDGYEVRGYKEGSYGQTYKITDKMTKNKYILKQLKPGYNEKEKERFNLEKNTLKNLSSPYIIKKYQMKKKFFKKHNLENSYLMEYCDYTLYDYIMNKNPILTEEKRRSIIRQLLEVVKYIHQKGIFHRDLSYTNVFINEYEDVVIVKLADFGLVKIKESSLTSINSDPKGSLLDPLIKDGHSGNYSDYAEINEIYSIGKLISFILTGRTAGGKSSNQEDYYNKYAPLINKCITLNQEERYQNINSVITAFGKTKK